MTYTYKLAHRLAVLRSSPVVGVLLLATACGSDNLSPSSGSDTPAEPSTAGAVVLMPRNVTGETDQPIKFAGFARSAAGDSLAGALQYTATGGTISPDGIFSAPSEGTYRIIAKGDGNTKPDTGTVTILAARKGLSAFVVAPDTAKVATGGKQTFTATGKFINGSTTAVGVNWSATGGTIDAGGTYTAGSVVGTYKVIATSASNRALADTATVILTTPTPTRVLQAVVVTPSTVSLQPGGTQQFVANGRMSDGTSSAVTVSWTATGGTITSGGLYAAGNTSGTYRVIAKQSGGMLADTVPVTITTTTAPSGIPISPGQSIQAAVNANPTGTTFVLKAGTHHGQSVIPKSGDTFVGEPGTILDGDSVTTYAFQRGSSLPLPANVTIRRLVIQRYRNAAQTGAIQAGDAQPTDGTLGWTVDSCEIRYNAGGGVRLGHKMKVRWNAIHHNGQIGIVGIGDSVLVEGNEIASNNYLKTYSAGWEAGGTKFVKTRWLVVRNNYSHDNWGPGLWTDGSNIYVLYEGNRVQNNAGEGIFHEISWNAVIRNNDVRGNGFGFPADWYWNAGILISTSSNVEIYGNTVVDNARGIIGIEQKRGTDQYGVQRLENLYVHDNDITMTVVRDDGSSHADVTGVAQDVGDLSYFTSRGNRFVHDTYHLGSAAKYFTWMNREVDVTTWTNTYRQDVTGTFLR